MTHAMNCTDLDERLADYLEGDLFRRGRQDHLELVIYRPRQKVHLSKVLTDASGRELQHAITRRVPQHQINGREVADVY